MTVDQIYIIWLSLFAAVIVLQLVQWGLRFVTKYQILKLKYFDNYPKKREKVNPGLNKIFFISAQVIVVLALGMTLYFQFLDYQVYKYYLFMLLPIAISDGSIVFYELTRNKYHYNLEPVDTAYYRIEGITSNAQNYAEDRNQLLIKLDAFMTHTRESLVQLLKGDSSSIFQSVIDSIEKERDTIERKIANLEKNITHLKERFIDLFTQYLNNEEPSFKEIFKEHSVDDTDRDAASEFQAITSKTQSKIQEAITSFISVNAHISLAESQQIFTILAQFDHSIDTNLVRTLLAKLSIESDEYAEFNTYFYQAQIDFKVIFEEYIVPSDKSWFFDRNLLKLPDRGLIRTIYKLVLTHHAKKSLQRLIETLDAQVISEIEDLTDLIETDPAIKQKIRVYAQITRQLFKAINPMNETENLLIALKTMKEPSPSTQSLLKEINAVAHMDDAWRQKVSQTYKTELARLAPLIIDSYEVIHYLKSITADDTPLLFDFSQLERYVLESAFQLDAVQIKLGYAFALVNAKYHRKLHDALREDPWKNKVERLHHHLNIEPNQVVNQSYQETFKYAVRNNQHFRAYQAILPQIIMRLEKQRLSLDKLMS